MRSLVLLVSLCCACAHSPLSKSSLNEIERVAFISRIAENAGPVSTVFRDDSSYRPKLSTRKIENKEADRRLAAVLSDGSYEKNSAGEKELKSRTLTRFELAEGLRSQILSQLPDRQPWRSAASPIDVARVLESFLVNEVPANEPDYDRLKQLGADSVMEVVIEEYGMRSNNGQSGVYLKGFARMFKIGGSEIYFRSFVSDELNANIPGQDPFLVAKNANLFVERLRTIMAAIAQTVASDLSSGTPVDVSEPTKMIKKKSTDDSTRSGPKQFEQKKEEVDPL